MTTPVTEATEPKPTEPETTQGDPADLGEAGKRALTSERAARKAAEDSARALQAKLDEIEASKLSDLERAQATARQHEEAAAKATIEALRWRTAARFGISDEDAETFLTGSDEASLTRQAERLSALAVKPPTTPRPDPSQGAPVQQRAGGGSVAAVMAERAAARQARTS